MRPAPSSHNNRHQTFHFHGICLSHRLCLPSSCHKTSHNPFRIPVLAGHVLSMQHHLPPAPQPRPLATKHPTILFGSPSLLDMFFQCNTIFLLLLNLVLPNVVVLNVTGVVLFECFHLFESVHRE